MEENSFKHTSEPKWQARAHFQPAGSPKQIHVIIHVGEILELDSSNEVVKKPRAGIVSFEFKVKFRTTHVISLSQFILPINLARNCFHLSVDQEIGGARVSCSVRRKTTSISFFLRLFFRY